MLYKEFKVGEKEFKLRMVASSIVALEKQLGGQNPLNILMGIESGQLPPVSAVLQILHAALQKFHHGMTYEKVLELYDEYVELGNSYTDLIPILIDVFKVSGFLPKTLNEEEDQPQPNPLQ
ncbi:DUF6096 family protein [Geobacillus kaustophilus]|uniref:DUF6096 family protein n=1 Tax=Geobacillus kaustophilus TaxID=1462 RepID=UPI0005CCB78A|nr:DUF6096 family protein [Geobacillus kaustophilus]